jgi:hypothetical protein
MMASILLALRRWSGYKLRWSLNKDEALAGTYEELWNAGEFETRCHKEWL